MPNLHWNCTREPHSLKFSQQMKFLRQSINKPRHLVPGTISINILFVFNVQLSGHVEDFVAANISCTIRQQRSHCTRLVGADSLLWL